MRIKPKNIFNQDSKKKPGLKLKKSGTGKKLKKPLKKCVNSGDSFYRPFTENELEEFIANSYGGEWNSKNSMFPNFPYKPERKKSKVVNTREGLEELAEKMKPLPAFAYDTETNTLKVNGPNRKFKCVDIQISWGSYDSYMIPLGHIRDEDIDNDRNADLQDFIELFKPIFENPYILIVGNNLKFDMHVLARLGIHVKTKKLFDNQLASWICDENTPNGLKENSMEKMSVPQEHFNEVTKTVPNEFKKRYGLKANSKATFDMVLIDDAAPYALDDPFMSWCLFLGFRQELIDEEMDKIFYKKMIPFLPVLFQMEETGVVVDYDRLKKMGEEMDKDLDSLSYKIFELARCVFNIGSAQQKAEILFGYRKPDKPIIKGKESKAVKAISAKLRSKKITENEALKLLEKENIYTDKDGKLWKRSNVNEAILSHSFNFKVLGKTDSGAPSTDNDTIWTLAHSEYKDKRKQQGVEMCKLIMEYSKISKLKSAFVDGTIEWMYDDGRIHCSFNQTGTDSGRLSCSKVNLQQLPKANEDDKYQIRDVYIGGDYYVVKSDYTDEVIGIVDNAEDLDKLMQDGDAYYVQKRKKIIAIDYHNLEMVCLAHFSQDKNLIDMFQNDDDAHGSTAVNMFELDCTPVECKKLYPDLRQAAKTINFLLMYGGGASLLYENLKNDHFSPIDLGSPEHLKQYGCRNGVEVARVYIDKYFTTYQGVAKFIARQKKTAHRRGYTLTVLGRKRRLPGINSSDGAERSYCERLAVNSPVQGTAGDITSSAQIRIYGEERLEEMCCKMLIQVHDELVFECPEEYLDEAIAIIKHDMEFPFGDNAENVKFLRADPGTGNSYQEAK